MEKIYNMDKNEFTQWKLLAEVPNKLCIFRRFKCKQHLTCLMELLLPCFEQKSILTLSKTCENPNETQRIS